MNPTFRILYNFTSVGRRHCASDSTERRKYTKSLQQANSLHHNTPHPFFPVQCFPLSMTMYIPEEIAKSWSPEQHGGALGA